jgi:hypothetical protein
MARHRVFLLYVFFASQKREPSSKMPGSLVRDLLNEHRLIRELALNRILFCLPDTASACEITPRYVSNSTGYARRRSTAESLNKQLEGGRSLGSPLAVPLKVEVSFCYVTSRLNSQRPTRKIVEPVY